MPGETTTRTPTVDEITGVHATPAHPQYPPGYGPCPPPPMLQRDTWVRIVVWLVPIIFTAGGLFVSVKALTARQDEQERDLKAEVERSTKLETQQQVMGAKVDSISAQQDKLVNKVETIDDKIDEQRAALSAIGERLGARPRPAHDDAPYPSPPPNTP